MQEKGINDQQKDEQEDDQRDETVSRDAFFDAQRAEAAHTTGGQIGDEPWIRSRWPAEQAPQPVQQRGQIIFADAELIELVR